MYEAIVVAAVAAHFAFLFYLVLGGFLAWRWRATIVAHIGVAAWGVAITLAHFECPLTDLERWARDAGGMTPLSSKGFIATYVTGVLYPSDAAGAVRIAVFVVVAISWLGYVRHWGTRRKQVGEGAGRLDIQSSIDPDRAARDEHHG
ncbi:DUF2784 domain-containing protein [Skermania sp. ID1734]|nr:DUF2784 domain-containing protein [Skermania sp. ID1734]